jgi:D-alanyl-D-alanine carboxypeptidase
MTTKGCFYHSNKAIHLFKNKLIIKIMFTHNKKSGYYLLKPLSIVLLMLATFAACKKGSTPNGPTPSGSIASFSFLKSANQIAVDATASINGPNITIFLPPGTNVNALKASFTLSGSGVVSVGGVTQQSGVTVNNFTSPVTYTVTQNGNTQSYTVTLTTDMTAIDQNVAAFMTKYNIPGLSIAITKDEKLVYVKAYGKADVEGNQNANTQNLYRISALSKQITSAAIMKLMDQGKLNMSDRVFGQGAILGYDYGTKAYTTWVSAITVGDLLHHTEGGWAYNDNDPFGYNPSMSIQQLISWALDNQPTINPPGSVFAYSHFGYSILGRVIEKITGMSYAQAVQSLVLQPSGISDMQIAGNGLAQRAPNEVKYYDQSGNNSAYSFNINRMDATNGWLASATDMARFLVHVDGLSSETILSQNAINVMSTGSTANPKYGCGWELTQFNWYHHGTLPGTGTSQAITTQSGNFNYVILANSAASDPNFSNDMDNIFWASLNNITTWPSYDLF